MRALSIARELSLPERVAQILIKRDLDESGLHSFLYSSSAHLHDPFMLPDMGLACDILKDVVENKKNIFIYGDFDADGITSTAVLYMSLLQLNTNVNYFIPNRLKEGYDLSVDAIKEHSGGRDQILITVDCGVKAVSQIKEVRDLFESIIILDHHNPGDELPEADAIVNPKLRSSDYPFTDLAGVGVVYKFLSALSGYYPDIVPDDYLDLVAIGTVADVVDLVDENRSLVKMGLSALSSEERRSGITALLEQANLVSDKITSWHISFIIAPRLNAPGRLSDPDISLKLLISDDIEEAGGYASQIERINTERKKIGNGVYKEAVGMVEEVDDFIVLSNNRWHPGVIGIVASRISEDFLRPTALISEDMSPARGSARSIGGLDLTEALSSQEDKLVRFGGHRDSAGFLIDRENIRDFRSGICRYAEKKLDYDEIQSKMIYDLRCDISEIDCSLIRGIELLEPYGEGNPEPRIYIRGARVVGDSKVVGDNHLKFKITDGVRVLNAIRFNDVGDLGLIKRGVLLNIIGTPLIDTWHGFETVTFKVESFEVTDSFSSICFEFKDYDEIDDIDNSLIIEGEEIRMGGDETGISLKSGIFTRDRDFSGDDMKIGGLSDKMNDIDKAIYLRPPGSRQELGLVAELVGCDGGGIIFAFTDEDIKKEIDSLRGIYPGQDELRILYRKIKEYERGEMKFDDFDEYISELSGDLSSTGVRNGLRIFNSLGLVDMDGGYPAVVNAERTEKVDLEDSAIYRLVRAMRESREEFLSSLRDYFDD